MAPCAGKKRMEGCLSPLWGFTSVSSHFGCGTFLAQQVTYRSKWRWKMDGSRSACFMRQFVREDMKCSEQADTLLPHNGYSVALVLRDKHVRSANRDMDPLQTRRCRFLSFTVKDYNNKENWLKKTGLNTEGFLSWQLDRSGVCSEISLILHPAKLWQTAFSNIERVKWQQLWEPEALALGCLQF